MSGWRRAADGWTITSRLRKLVLLCWVMLFLVCVTAVGSLAVHSETINRLTLIVVPARDANVQIRQAMTDAQTGLEAYRASGNRTLLQPYFGAQNRTMAALATLDDKLAQGAVDETDALRHHDYAKLQRQAVEQWWATAISVEQALSRGNRVDLYQNRALFARFSDTSDALGDYLTTEQGEALLEAQTMVKQGQAISIAVTFAALLVMLVMGSRMADSISRPLTELRDAVVRQRQGEQGAHAREDEGSSEVRSIAFDFNALSEQNSALLQTQTRALDAHQVTSRIGRALRETSDTQQALVVVCAELGDELGFDRVIGNTFGNDHMPSFDAQWHRPDLQPVTDLSVLSDLGEVAEEMWASVEYQAQDDLLAAEAQPGERVQGLCRVTGARAAIMVPIGLGGRVIGTICGLMVNGPRVWDTSEVDTVKVVAGFVARAIVAAESLANQREYVERVERLEGQKSDFLATVAHELRTPLASIAGYLELLQDEEAGKLTAQQHKMLEVIGRGTIRLRSMIEDVMMLNRIEGGVSSANLVPVPTRALVTRVIEELEPLAQRSGIVLEIDAGPETAVVLGDRASLDRALANILTNAIKFSHREGVVTVTGLVDHDARRVLIICQDRGVGIPERDLGELFTRFFRASNATDQSIPGTGLGLSIAKQIVEDHHGGSLRLVSAEGEGTTVVIDLPLYELSHVPDPEGNDSLPDDVFGIRA